MAQTLIYIDKKVNLTKNDILAITQAVSASLVSALGQFSTETETSAPASGVKLSLVKASESELPLAGSTSREDVEIEINESKIENRMKLPARMFGEKEIVIIDGTEYHALESDNGRSAPFPPSQLDASLGQTVTFSFLKKTVKAMHWSCEVSGKRKGKKSTPAPAPTPAKKVTGKAGAKKEREVVTVNTKTMKTAIADFAQMAIENAGRNKVNQNIVDTDFTKGQPDARMYLSTAQNQKLRSVRKSFNVSLTKTISMLNAEVFED